MSDNEYTPTTAAIRESHAFTTQSKIAGATFGQGLAEFDRWLAAHDREVAAKALTDAATLLEPFSGIGLANGANRTDVANWLRARAAALGVPVSPESEGKK